MSGKFILEESQLLKIIAGQTGIGNSNGAGGGGGSFVVNGVDSTLLIAAGGGSTVSWWCKNRPGKFGCICI